MFKVTVTACLRKGFVPFLSGCVVLFYFLSKYFATILQLTWLKRTYISFITTKHV